MKPITQETWLKKLNNGDIGLILSKNPFSSLQNLFRKKFKEGEHRASHGFYVKTPPCISEANGLFIKPNQMLIKNIGGKTKVWIFRYKYLTNTQLEKMNVYAEAAEETKGQYSLKGIMQFAKRFLFKTKMKDTAGVFCTEYTSHIIISGGCNYIKDKWPHEIDPSTQLNWMMSSDDWELTLYYNGEGQYYG